MDPKPYTRPTLAMIVAALLGGLVPLLPPQYQAIAPGIITPLAMLVGLIQPQIKIKLPSGIKKGPPIGLALLLVLLPTQIQGCGGSVRPEVQDAHTITQAAFQCVEGANQAEDLLLALADCGKSSLTVVGVLCSTGVLQSGPFCGTALQALELVSKEEARAHKPES